MSVVTVLADAMALAAEERAQLARWLDLCVRMDLHLEPESVRMATERDLRTMLGGFQP